MENSTAKSNNAQAPENIGENQYLKFGKPEGYSFVSPSGLLNYLKAHGFGDNSLTQARYRIAESSIFKKITEKTNEGAHYCDFCGQELGVEYDILSDRRERCYECSKTVVESLEDFREVYIEVKRNMEVMFGINFFASINVVTTSAREIAAKTGFHFVPTSGYDGRPLGFATDNHGVYTINVENQSPYLCAVSTIAHELTHVWQYINWDKKEIKKKYFAKIKKEFPSHKPELVLYEGMAKWVEIQYLFLINEKERAYREMVYTMNRKDEYGLGFLIFYQKYGITNGTFIEGTTPFIQKNNPI